MSYLLIGLGNPGEKYKWTRHNAGKAFAGWIKEEGRGKKEEGKWEIAETECFMNESGGWVKRKMATMAKNGYNGDNHSDHSNHYDHLFISHDDLDIPLGKFKIQFGKGPRLHKGILSIEQALGTKEFWRVRIGIEGRRTKDEGRRTSGEDYVLEKFTAAEKKILESVFPDTRDRLSKKVGPFEAKNVVI